MAKPSFDQFTEMLERVVQRIPPRFCRDLPGGFNVQKGRKREGEYYILGEYVEDYYLGSFIVFYYGSFVALLGGEPWGAWEAEILDTVLHELQHHREALAGRDDLGQQELAELLREKQEKLDRDKPKEPRKSRPTDKKSLGKTLSERISQRLSQSLKPKP